IANRSPNDEASLTNHENSRTYGDSGTPASPCILSAESAEGRGEEQCCLPHVPPRPMRLTFLRSPDRLEFGISCPNPEQAHRGIDVEPPHPVFGDRMRFGEFDAVLLVSKPAVVGFVLAAAQVLTDEANVFVIAFLILEVIDVAGLGAPGRVGL